MGTVAKKGGEHKYVYYRCPCAQSREYKDYVRECTNKTHYRVDQVDRLAWEKIRGWMLNPEALVQELRQQQAEKDAENEPLRRQLGIVERLLRESREQYERLVDLYLNGEFPKEMLQDRKTRLETTVRQLEQELATLQESLETQTLRETEIRDIFELAEAIQEGLAEADRDFDHRRGLIEMLNVRAYLYVEEDGARWMRLSCRILGKEASLSLSGKTPCSAAA